MAIRVSRALNKKNVPSPKAPQRLRPLPELTKQILVFNRDEFRHLMHGFVLLRMPDGELGVSSRKVVYPIRYSGEYLFIDVSIRGKPKTSCSVVSSTAIASERFPVTPSRPFQTLAKEHSDHADGAKLETLASKFPSAPDAKRTAKVSTKISAMSFAERWLRQLNLSLNQTASEEVRKKALEQLARIEEQLLALDGEYFKWPSTDALKGNGSLNSFDAPEDGVLSFFGYKVGQLSVLTPSMRYAILDRVFRIALPPVLPSPHMALWGTPNSLRRLHKLAETIAAFVRNAKRRQNPSYRRAIGEWEHDLQRLHDTLYVGRFDFSWPATH
ncbi:hypothetical protein M0412_08755 [Agrobacterium sp. O3.4]|uniref:Uncharacterized protein n=2 Tax=Rhizobium/Agrobacterium group TaxID=227290 RepID=A0A546XNI9_RHIRH|nr:MULTISPECIES: hypothetical protein [Rhizobium/Agrobacterium group]MCZ7468148.1 hypothetical protein [Rhizobium rhizogenes]TRB02297.1 hypothetical protein EXN68_00915 [Rhizobium rhizogenes]WHO08706.1 hypothetical protein KZ699_02605 [Agrobacterium cucumeris]